MNLKPVAFNKSKDEWNVHKYQWVNTGYPLTDHITIGIGIDKVTIGMPFRSPTLATLNIAPHKTEEHVKAQAHYKKQYFDHVNYATRYLKSEFHCLPPKKASKETSLFRLNVLCEKDDTHVVTVNFGIYFGTPTFSYTFNPSKLTGNGAAELEMVFDATLPLGYESLYSEGIVSHIELFVDVEGSMHGDLVLLDTGKRKTTLFHETTYHGRRRSVLVGTAYDKGKEARLDSPRTRLEFRVKQPHWTFQQFVESQPKNPLSAFLVISVKDLKSVTDCWKESPTLMRDILQHGLFGGIKNSHCRKAVIKKLKQCVMPWWNPDELWKDFCEIKLRFCPAFVGGYREECFPAFSSKTPNFFKSNSKVNCN